MTLASSLDLESLAKPILYSDWKREQGIKTTDPFAVDPVLSSPLPLLVNPEQMGIVPIFSDPTVILSARLPARQGAKNLDPSVSPQDATVVPDDPSPIPHSSPNPQSSPTRSPSIGREDESAAPFGGSLPRFSHTPLIWDALQRREEEKTERMKKNLKPFFWLSRRRTNLGANE